MRSLRRLTVRLVTAAKRDPIAAAIMADERFIRRTITRRGIAPADVDSVVSLVVEAVWKAGASGRLDVRDLAAMRRWVNVVARRLAVDHHRTVARRARDEWSESGILTPNAEEQLAAREALRFIESRLTSDELFYLEQIVNEATTAEIAALAKLPQGTVATRVRRLRLRLWAALMRRSVIFAKLYAAEVPGPPFPLPLVHASGYGEAATSCGLTIRPVERSGPGRGGEYLKPYRCGGILVAMYHGIVTCRLCLRALDAQRQAEMDAYDRAHPAPESER